VKLTVYSTEGETIEKLIDEEKNGGTYEVIFRSFLGSEQLADGSYTYCLEAGSYKNNGSIKMKYSKSSLINLKLFSNFFKGGSYETDARSFRIFSPSALFLHSFCAR
jgi:hypothetical protein